MPKKHQKRRAKPHGFTVFRSPLYYPFPFRSLVTYALALNHELAETLSKNEKSKKGLQKREAEEEEKPESGNH